MTIEEAIRLKELRGDEFLKADPDDLDMAEGLSIEALKFISEWHDQLKVAGFFPLPGETEES